MPFASVLAADVATWPLLLGVENTTSFPAIGEPALSVRRTVGTVDSAELVGPD
jgi:hypothetical protein